MKILKMGLLALTCFVFSKISFSQAPTANGNVMVFSSVASYEPYTDDESTWASLRNIAVQSSTLTTLAEPSFSQNADTLYPDFLKEVLNTDKIFQIGNYLIKIDPLNQRGLVIAAGNTNAYTDLVNDNLSATGMMALDGDEDFGLELLEALESNAITPAGYQSFLTEGRACAGAGREKDARTPEWATTSEQCDIGGSYTIGRTYGMDNKVVYQKFIFFFSIESKIRSVWRCTFGGSWTLAPIYTYVDLTLTGTVKYRRRCGDEVKDGVSLEEKASTGGDGILNWRPYNGGRSLSKYDCNVEFAIRIAQSPAPGPPVNAYYPSGNYRIVWGY